MFADSLFHMDAEILRSATWCLVWLIATQGVVCIACGLVGYSAGQRTGGTGAAASRISDRAAAGEPGDIPGASHAPATVHIAAACGKYHLTPNCPSLANAKKVECKELCKHCRSAAGRKGE